MSELVAPGATQMAIDTWLLNQVIEGQRSPTLRFYRWQPAAISLGYHQKHWPEHWQSLSWLGTPVNIVRRPTGGRAVLHQGDLTYAIVVPLMGKRRQDWYQIICNALIKAWSLLGVSLSYGTAGRGYRNKTNCFDLATTADLITSTGYKLIGSAQLKRDRCLLQHGSIRLWPDSKLYGQVFGKGISDKEPPATIPNTFEIRWLEQLRDLIVDSLARSLSITFETNSLSNVEISEISNACH